MRLFRRTRALFTRPDGSRGEAYIGDNGSVREVVAVETNGLRLRGESGKVGLVTWDKLRDNDTGRLLLTYGDCRTIDSSQGITSDEHINALPGGSRHVQGFKNYVAESRHRVSSWMVGSMGLEMREVQERRPLGAAEPTQAEQRGEAWANLVRNLSRFPTKESALGFLQGVTAEREAAARAMQTGLRKQEAREATGHPRMTAARRVQERQAVKPLQRVAQTLEQTSRDLSVVTSSLAAMRDYWAGKEDRRIEVAANLVAEGKIGYADAEWRLILLSRGTKLETTRSALSTIRSCCHSMLNLSSR